MGAQIDRITPAQVELVAPRADLNFFDQQSVVVSTPMTPLEAWTRIMAEPLPFMATAFKLRDAISAQFGVKRIGGFSGKAPGFVQVGPGIRGVPKEAGSGPGASGNQAPSGAHTEKSL